MDKLTRFVFWQDDEHHAMVMINGNFAIEIHDEGDGIIVNILDTQSEVAASTWATYNELITEDE